MDQDLHDRLTGWRRDLHRHPELSLHEADTARFLQARLTELGIPFESGIGGHGIVATLTRGGSSNSGSNRSVGLRTDMDALPIHETTGTPYASETPGVMHACGHDGHMAGLLGAAILLQRDPGWTGTVRLVFQPAEEGFGGAGAMLADGLLDRFPMERIFGLHTWPGLPAGTVAVHGGAGRRAPVMAAGTRLRITLDGHAGHAAQPHLTRDPMLGAAHLLLALQSVVSRNTDPLDAAVLSICRIDGGDAENQIPDRATLRGTMRSHDPAVHEAMTARVRAISHGIAAALDLRASFDLDSHVTATINHGPEADLAAAAATALGAELRRDLAPSMASEDFGAYLEQRPGAFVWVGNGPAEGGRSLHNSGFDFNDAILPTTAGWLAAVARAALAGE
jgi:amidohydrolase